MRVATYENPHDLSAVVTRFLERREVENCLLLGRVSEAVADWPGTGRYKSQPLLLAVESGGEIVAAATADESHPLVLSEAAPDAVAAVVTHLKGAAIRPAGVTAPEPTAQSFDACWRAAGGGTSRLAVGLRLFELRRVTEPRPPGGAFRAAEAVDVETLVPWAEGFFRDVGEPPRVPQSLRADLVRRIELGRLFVWCDPGPVSMAGWAGQTPHGARVNFVYTPPHNRTRGYASACVASLSQYLLDSGRRFCCLFTDVSNRTSNHIYQALGYQPVRDFARFMFEPDPAG